MATSTVPISENSRELLREWAQKTGQTTSELLDKALDAYRPEVAGARETVVAPWRFLVRRQHPWRKQLYIKGRNLTARQLVGSIKANQFDDEKAAKNFHLPVEAVREALAYVESHSELLQTEAEIERVMHQREGDPRGSQPLYLDKGTRTS